MPNRLASEVSPYLRQHMHNPVDWYPWGEEAFARARAEQKPVLLSVGYAACHWCHVMEKDAFEVPEVAERMNRSFVSIKVDREERPDVDQLYQGVVQLMNRGGGWPLTVFLTPDGRPFFGGTYFPPVDRHGLPSFARILDALADAWSTRRAEVLESADSFAQGLGQLARFGMPGEPSAWSAEDLDRAAARMLQDADPLHGGFHGAPKFPNPMDLAFLLREGGEEGRAHVRRTLHAMARGGIHDQLGGGFHRYSVDASWSVPHFEKMLYDNALLVRLYAEAAVALGEPSFAQVARGIFAWMEREMRDPAGGFFSSQDADSEGEEGRFFVWTPAQVIAELGAQEGALLCEHLGVREGGNFEHGTTVLHVARDAATIAAERGEDAAAIERRLEHGKERLRLAREKRVRPATDDKVLTSWNGLAIGGLAAAGRLLGEPAMVAAAARAAEFVLGTAGAGGTLLRVVREGRARQAAFLDDHAHLAEGLVELFAATGEARWLEAARAQLHAIRARFHDPRTGAFHLVPEGGEALLERPASVHDNAIPAGASSAVHAWLAASALAGDPADEASGWLEGQRDAMLRSPLAFGHLLCAASHAVRGITEVAVIGAPGPARDALLAAARDGFRPHVIAFAAEAGPGELLAGKGEVAGRPAAYVCRAFACEAPRTEPAELARALEAA